MPARSIPAADLLLSPGITPVQAPVTMPRLNRYLYTLGCLFSAVLHADSQWPENLVADGIPEIPAALRSEVVRYLEFRTASFQDWHPRRREILISTRFAETLQLHQVKWPEGDRRQLTFQPEPVFGALFQPMTGESIVFSQDSGGGEFFQIYRLDPADGRLALLTDGKSRNTDPRWSRDGRRLAYASTRRNGRDTDIYLIDPAHPESDRRLAELSGGGWSVSDWSPDGAQLLVQSYVSINESSLYLMDAARGDLRLVVPANGRKASYAGGRFTQDGKSALVVTDAGGEFRSLATVDLSSGLLAPFGPSPAGDVEDFGLSPDGRKLAYFVNEIGFSALHIVDFPSGRTRSVPRLPMGVATGLRWHPNSRDLGFSLSSAKSPSDVYSIDARRGTLTRWTASETGGVSPARYVEPELVRLKSSDGLALSGFLYRPDPRRFPGPRPVLVSIHGGPEGQSRPIFQARWNYLLDQLGVAILYPNVRGSAGFGKTFLTLDNSLHREDSVKDIGAYLDWIATQPSLDSRRVAAYGGSYGGFMVLASMAMHGDRLRCGIDVVGISNFISFLENTQDYRRDLRRAEYGDERIPEVAAYLRRVSPMSHVSEIRRPLLVVQGKNDPRVPVSEAEQMVKAIRGQGGTVAYLMAKDEGHGFQKKKNSDAMFLVLSQFLQEHLLR